MLGIAHYRAGCFDEAIEALGKSVELSHGGDNIDFYFRAMADWQHGERDQARTWARRAQANKRTRDGPNNPYVVLIRQEAETLMGIGNLDDLDAGGPAMAAGVAGPNVAEMADEGLLDSQ